MTLLNPATGQYVQMKHRYVEYAEWLDAICGLCELDSLKFRYGRSFAQIPDEISVRVRCVQTSRFSGGFGNEGARGFALNQFSAKLLDPLQLLLAGKIHSD